MGITSNHGSDRRRSTAWRSALILLAGFALAGCDGACLGGLRGVIAWRAKPQLEPFWTPTETSPTDHLYVSFDRSIPEREVGLDPIVPYVTDAAFANEQVEVTDSLPMVLTGPDGGVPGLFSYYVGTDAEGDTGYMTFDPLEPLASSTAYRLDVVYADATIELTTSDRPYVTAVSPHPGLRQMPYQSLDQPENVTESTVFEITFSEDVDVTTVTPDTVVLYGLDGSGAGSEIATSVGYDGVSRTATVDPVDGAMNADRYELNIRGSGGIRTGDGRELHGVTFYFDK